MITIVHTFDAPDHDRLLADVRRGIETMPGIDGFKSSSLNQQENSNEIMVMSQWESRNAFESWRHTLGENKAYKQATPQVFAVLEERS